MTVTLETERLLLRMWRLDDFEPYARICADPEVMRFLTGPPMSRLEAWRHMASVVGHWHLLGFGVWAVEEKATGAMVGRIGCQQPEGWPDFEIAWTLDRSCWGKGYATEGASAAMGYAFETLGRDHVISLIRPGNTPSIRVAERLGETVQGETEIMGLHVLIYGIDRETWRRRSGRLQD
ncbi:MAG TPA: GNAT family N-acetyltransferase [Thermoanaerobaculia bacterium]|nr:GNAT family N-acetyltransferase [Thermoanaerobaculia bacterium]